MNIGFSNENMFLAELQFYQRPIPASVQDLGTWESIFQLITVAAVITNAGLVCYTMTVFSDYTIYGRTWYALYNSGSTANIFSSLDLTTWEIQVIYRISVGAAVLAVLCVNFYSRRDGGVRHSEEAPGIHREQGQPNRE